MSAAVTQLFASLGPMFLLVFAALAIAVAAMAIGVMFRRPCLRGSCGGPGIVGPDGTSLSCDTCPNRRRSRA